MKITNIFLAGLSVLLVCIALSAATASDDVLSALEAIYQDDMVRDKEPFSKRLSELHEAAIKRSQELDSPVSGLDFDYAVNGQDFEDGLVASVVYSVTEENADTAVVSVTFKNFDVQTLGYNLVKENGAWRVDDVKCLSPDCDWVLSELYIEGAAQAE